MLNIKNKIITYHNYLILLWWIVLLIAFRFINNFRFQHGSSVIFLVLFFLPPLGLKVISLRHRRHVKKQKVARKSGYFTQIKDDVGEGVFQSQLVNPLRSLFRKAETAYQETKITVDINSQAELVFDSDKASLVIHDTMIKYRFYYSNRFEDLTKYDSRGFEHYPTEKLYRAVLNLLKNLTGDLVYEEVRQGGKILGCLLSKNGEVLYNIVEEPKKGLFAPKIKKDTKTVNLQKLKE